MVPGTHHEHEQHFGAIWLSALVNIGSLATGHRAYELVLMHVREGQLSTCAFKDNHGKGVHIDLLIVRAAEHELWGLPMRCSHVHRELLTHVRVGDDSRE